MKKSIAGVAAALTLGALTFAGIAPASATYGPPKPPVSNPSSHTKPAPSGKTVTKDVTKAVKKKGPISKAKAKKLTKEIKAAQKAHKLSKAKAKKLLNQIKKDLKSKKKH
jgi:Xaa-Pro aminopeptidase